MSDSANILVILALLLLVKYLRWKHRWCGRPSPLLLPSSWLLPPRRPAPSWSPRPRWPDQIVVEHVNELWLISNIFWINLCHSEKLLSALVWQEKCIHVWTWTIVQVFPILMGDTMYYLVCVQRRGVGVLCEPLLSFFPNWRHNVSSQCTVHRKKGGWCVKVLPLIGELLLHSRCLFSFSHCIDCLHL